jgi:predicted RNA-binding Zn-ribbon protein involved in translation (DUF1610 family)/predicted DNA binding CopG/RHH family protein
MKGVIIMFESNKRIREKVLRHALGARDQAVSEAMKRKEEYLGARVPKELREKVIQRAKDMGIPVSILIRNVLEEAFGGGAQAGGRRAGVSGLQSYQEPAKTTGVDRFPSVLGWEEISLNKTLDCSSCGKSMMAGSKATLGFAAPGENHVILCHACRRHL